MTTAREMVRVTEDLVRFADGVVVRRVRFRDGESGGITAFEPSATEIMQVRHGSTMRFVDGEPGIDPQMYHGEIAARNLPAELEALPVGDERTARVRAFQAERYALSLDYIREAFPETSGPELPRGWSVVRGHVEIRV